MNSINYAIVRRLILKDWYLNRWFILAAIPLGLGALALNLTGSRIATLFSIIIVCIVLIGVGAQLAMITTVNERKEQTLPFVMSLPLSYREYTAAKILANLILFLVPWLILTAGTLGVLSLPGAGHGLIPYTAIMAMEILITNCLIIVAGVITESMAWASVAITCCSLGLNGLGYAFAHLRGISTYMWGQQAHWTPTAWTVLVAEALTVALLMWLTFFIQSRKTDFL